MQGRIPGGQAGQPLVNIRLVLAFDGTDYCGWQAQPGRLTIQGALLEAIREIAREPVSLHGSGRTDAGTHARMLVANFQTRARLAPDAWRRALNSRLPETIRILRASRAPRRFHARRDAASKVYRYQIWRSPVMPPHLAREHFHYPYPLDLAAMREAASGFVGERDFGSFAARTGAGLRERPGSDEAPGRGTRRTIFGCSLKDSGTRLLFTVEGDGFLHHMVRNMVGTLLEVGRARMTLERFRTLFDRPDRAGAGPTVPARGLILLRVRYRRRRAA